MRRWAETDEETIRIETMMDGSALELDYGREHTQYCWSEHVHSHSCRVGVAAKESARAPTETAHGFVTLMVIRDHWVMR